MSKRHSPRGKIKATEDASECPPPSADVRKAGRERAILALVRHNTLAAAATECGVNERTLRRWLVDESFKAQVDEARQGTLKSGLDLLAAYQDKAIARIFALSEQTEYPSTALSASKDILDRVMGQSTAKVEMNVSVELAVVVSRLASARQRLAAKRETA